MSSSGSPGPSTPPGVVSRRSTTVPSWGAVTTRRSRTSLAARKGSAVGLLAAGLVELLTDVGQSGAALGLDVEPGCRGTLARSRHGTAQLGVPCLDRGQLSLQLLRTGARFPALRQKPLRALELTLERGTLPLHGVTLLRRRSCVLLLLLDLARQRADLRLVGQPAGCEQFLLPRQTTAPQASPDRAGRRSTRSPADRRARPAAVRSERVWRTGDPRVRQPAPGPSPGPGAPVSVPPRTRSPSRTRSSRRIPPSRCCTVLRRPSTTT